jgi:predicted glycogen debranching enzyme
MSNGMAEWLEADGLGGFASGTADLVRTRRYHALLLAATTPPTGRVALVNGLEVWVETKHGSVALSSQRYAPGVVHPDGAGRIESFEYQPWPAWTFRLEDGTRVRQEIFLRHEMPLACVSWRLINKRAGVRLEARPLLSGRDAHELHHENGKFRFEAHTIADVLAWRPYSDLPAIFAHGNGEYRHDPAWYKSFLYLDERERGLDDTEDLASPGVFTFDLSRGEATLLLGAETEETRALLSGQPPTTLLSKLRNAEKRRRKFPAALDRAADAYLVRRGAGRTIVAGYPWFTDWGRDTFIAMRGLCLATGRLDDARRILVEWSGHVSEGMLPNRFVDQGGYPEYNSVDASLWFIIAVHDLLRAFDRGKKKLPAKERARLLGAVEAILMGYARGTRFGIRRDDDGLLACGEPGVQLTWMDAKVDDWVVTPRIGKPVEVQALWLNALRIAHELGIDRVASPEPGLASFRERFWNPEAECLFDVIDADHQPGAADPSFRPNQLFAIGGLPHALIAGERARRVVDECERRLMTPMGPRSLAPGEPSYAPAYIGDRRERDGAYHQGTVWPWLTGAFVEAWLRVRDNDPAIRREARDRFLAPLLRHLEDAGLGHLSEIADAEPPYTPRGCPFQAWSVGEALRLDHVVLAEGGGWGEAVDEMEAAGARVSG